jgi:hypothetical protein
MLNTLSHSLLGMYNLQYVFSSVSTEIEKEYWMQAESEGKPTPLSRVEAGRKGGNAVRDKYGVEYYRRIGKSGGDALKAKRGVSYYSTLAQKGGQAFVARYGVDSFSQLGKKGGDTTKQRQGADYYQRIGKQGGAGKRKKSEGLQ